MIRGILNFHSVLVCNAFKTTNNAVYLLMKGLNPSFCVHKLVNRSKFCFKQ